MLQINLFDALVSPASEIIRSIGMITHQGEVGVIIARKNRIIRYRKA